MNLSAEVKQTEETPRNQGAEPRVTCMSPALASESRGPPASDRHLPGQQAQPHHLQYHSGPPPARHEAHSGWG